MERTIRIEELNEKEFMEYIKEGKVIVYPTDTVYGIGCDAKNSTAVQKIRSIKGGTDKPFSIIAPSKSWVYENFEVKNKSYIEKLPGPYTFILNALKEGIVSRHAVNGRKMGIRIPDHKMTNLIQKTKTPFVTISAGIGSGETVNDIAKIPKEVLKHVDMVIDAGTLTNHQSVVIDLTEEIPVIVKRK